MKTRYFPKKPIHKLHEDSMKFLEDRAKDGDMLAVWEAIRLCTMLGAGDVRRLGHIPFPDWVVEYLAWGAKNINKIMDETDPSGTRGASREAESIGKALGFGRKARGRGNTFSREAKRRRRDHIRFYVDGCLSFDKSLTFGNSLYEKVAKNVNTSPGIVEETVADIKKDFGGKWPPRFDAD